MAPEIIKKEIYNEKVDVWAIGVIAYMLLTGRNPFPGVGKAQVKHMIVTKELDYEKPYFKALSNEAVDFVKCALTRNIDERYSCA